MNKKYISAIEWVMGLIIPIAIALLPLGIPYEIQMWLALTTFAVIFWLFELLPNSIVGLLLCIFYFMSKIVTPSVAFAAWTTAIPWVVVGGLLFGIAMIETGLAKRIAYWMIIKLGGSYIAVLFSICIVGLILSLFDPDPMSKVAILLPIGVGVCQAMKIEPQHRLASAAMLAVYFGGMSSCQAYLTGGAHMVMAAEMVEKVTGEKILWITWLIQNFVPAVLWIVMSLLVTILVLRVRRAEHKTITDDKTILDEVRKQYSELGPMQSSEKKLAVILLVLLALCATDFVHGISASWLFPIIAPILFIPRVNILKAEHVNKINFGIILFIIGAMEIGVVAANVGAANMIADAIKPVIAGTPLYMAFSTWLFAFIINFFMTPLGGISALTTPIAQIAANAGVRPELAMYGFLYGLDTFIFPYEVAPFLYVFAFGYMSFHDALKVMVVRTIAAALFMVAVAYPYWALIGLA